jgi:DNA-binding transcriptional ArsR family regulator
MVPEHIGTERGPQDRLSLIFGALAHPARRQILARLAEGDASITELAEPFEVTVRAISKHIGVLERAGLVTRTRDAQKRPSHLDTAAFRKAHEWLDTYRVLWERRFDRIDSLIEHEKNGGRRLEAKRRRPHQ